MFNLVSFLVCIAVVPQVSADLAPKASLAAPKWKNTPVSSTSDTGIQPARRRTAQAAAITLVDIVLASSSSTHSTSSSSSSSSSSTHSTSLSSSSSGSSTHSTSLSSSSKSSLSPSSSSTDSTSSSSPLKSSSSSSTSSSTNSHLSTGPITKTSSVPKPTYTVSHGKTHDSDSAGGFFMFGGSGGGVLAFPDLFKNIKFDIPEGGLDDVETGKDGKPTTTSKMTTEPETSTRTSSSSLCSTTTGYDYWVECYSTTTSGQSLGCVTISTSKTIGCSPTTTATTTTLAPACGQNYPSDGESEGEEGGCIDDVDCDIAYCLGTVAPPTHGTGPGAYVNATCQQYLTGCNCTASYLTPGFCSGYITYCSLPNCNGHEVNGQWNCTGQFAGCPCTHVATTTTTTTSSSSSSTSYAYASATAGTGCADITYYNYLDADFVSTSQCWDFCSSDTNCQAAMLQCSQSEPCVCWINNHPFTPSDLECDVDSQYYGQFTYYNKSVPV